MTARSPWPALGALLALAVAAAPAAEAAAARPNVLIVVADDLGYSDIAPFGGEIRTPTLDALAAEGVRLSQFHVHATCSPTRAMLLTGVDSHVVGFGTMRDDETPEQKGRPGYETFLNDRALTLAEVLRDAGYATFIAGKWDMGVTDDRGPDRRGFTESFVLLQGSADHFEQREAMPGVVPKYRHNGREVGLPPDFLSSRHYTDRMIGFIADHRRQDQPFFGILAYTAPHYPLQASDAFIERYAGTYDAGYEPVRSARLARQRASGLVDPALVPAAPHPAWPRWADLPQDIRRLESRRMQVYAAMVEEMDHHLGRLVAYLRESGELDDTLILFMSDNGADGSNPLDWGWAEWATATRDLRYENMGRRNSYVWQGPGWAAVSSAPYRQFKFFTTQGGLLAPAIARYPARIPAGRTVDAFATVLDVFPTLLEFAGVDAPRRFPTGRASAPLQGRSMLGVLSGREPRVHDDEDFVGWEIYNRRAVRQGDLKITWINQPWGRGLGTWSLYDLARDPAEAVDLADARPADLARMLRLWDRYVEENGVIAVDHYVPPITNRFSHFEWRPPVAGRTDTDVQQ